MKKCIVADMDNRCTCYLHYSIQCIYRMMKEEFKNSF